MEAEVSQHMGEEKRKRAKDVVDIAVTTDFADGIPEWPPFISWCRRCGMEAIYRFCYGAKTQRGGTDSEGAGVFTRKMKRSGNENLPYSQVSDMTNKLNEQVNFFSQLRTFPNLVSQFLRR